VRSPVLVVAITGRRHALVHAEQVWPLFGTRDAEDEAEHVLRTTRNDLQEAEKCSDIADGLRNGCAALEREPGPTMNVPDFLNPSKDSMIKPFVVA
jgi:hypothetical protein